MWRGGITYRPRCWTGLQRPADYRYRSRAAFCDAAMCWDARGQQLSIFQTTPALHTQSARRRWHGRCCARTWPAFLARAVHAQKSAKPCRTKVGLKHVSKHCSTSAFDLISSSVTGTTTTRSDVYDVDVCWRVWTRRWRALRRLGNRLSNVSYDLRSPYPQQLPTQAAQWNTE